MGLDRGLQEVQGGLGAGCEVKPWALLASSRAKESPAAGRGAGSGDLELRMALPTRLGGHLQPVQGWAAVRAAR